MYWLKGALIVAAIGLVSSWPMSIAAAQTMPVAQVDAADGKRILDGLVGKTWINGAVKASVAMDPDGRYKIKVWLDTHYINLGAVGAPTSKTSIQGTVLLETSFEYGPNGFIIAGISRFKHKSIFVLSPGRLRYMIYMKKGDGFALFEDEQFIDTADPHADLMLADLAAKTNARGPREALSYEQARDLVFQQKVRDLPPAIASTVPPVATPVAIPSSQRVTPRSRAAAPVATEAPVVQASGARPRSEAMEKLYAQECPHQEDTQVCNALRKALIAKLTGAPEPAPRTPNRTVARTAARASAPQPAFAAAPSGPDLQSPELVRWGIWRFAADNSWLGSTGTLYTYSWMRPGEVLSAEVVSKEGTAYNTFTISSDGSISINVSGTSLTLTPMPDGSFVQPISKKVRYHYQLQDGILKVSAEKVQNGFWQATDDVASDQRRLVPAAQLATIRDRAKRQQEIAAQTAREAAQAAESAPRSGHGGLFGALGGAALGAMMGGSAEQIVGTALKGAAMVDPNVAALGGVGDTLITGNADMASGIAGVGSVGGGSGASYPTRGNALDGSQACSMMNLNNYRTVALSGNPDAQLKTMCGQAFEYYHMYLNAIQQGYSEDDANRTYSAHEQSARVAISFYENAR